MTRDLFLWDSVSSSGSEADDSYLPGCCEDQIRRREASSLVLCPCVGVWVLFSHTSQGCSLQEESEWLFWGCLILLTVWPRIWDNPIFIVLPCSSLKFASARPSTDSDRKTHSRCYITSRNLCTRHSCYLSGVSQMSSHFLTQDLKSSGHSWNVDLNHTRLQITACTQPGPHNFFLKIMVVLLFLYSLTHSSKSRPSLFHSLMSCDSECVSVCV